MLLEYMDDDVEGLLEKFGPMPEKLVRLYSRQASFECVDTRTDTRWASLESSRRDGRKEYRHVFTRALDMPSVMPIHHAYAARHTPLRRL